MRLILFLVRKYLITRNSSLSINIISAISILGLAIGTAALVIVLSVFNGFEDLLSGMFNKHNPDIKIVHVSGKSFAEDSSLLSKIKQFPEVKIVSRVYEQSCMFQYGEMQDFGLLRGIDQNYVELVSLDSSIVEGKLVEHTAGSNFAYLSLGLSNKLGVSIENFISHISAYTPTSTKGQIEIGNEQFKRYILQPRLSFSFKQELDNEVILTDLDEFRKYINDKSALTSIQIKLHDAKQSKALVNKLKNLLGSEYLIKDRYLQDEAFLKIMNLEKWLFFTLFLFTLILVSFTIVGTLWMIVIEKRFDISMMKSLGMPTKDIQKVFYGVGIGIGLVGLLLGFILALFFYGLQSEYALIKVPEEFIIKSYPMAIRLRDFFIVGFVVLGIVYAACLLPTAQIKEVKTIFIED
ncbi:MAG: FtsX-like permease family protein [Saprospiraceae bacterium]